MENLPPDQEVLLQKFSEDLINLMKSYETPVNDGVYALVFTGLLGEIILAQTDKKERINAQVTIQTMIMRYITDNLIPANQLPKPTESVEEKTI